MRSSTSEKTRSDPTLCLASPVENDNQYSREDRVNLLNAPDRLVEAKDVISN